MWQYYPLCCGTLQHGFGGACVPPSIEAEMLPMLTLLCGLRAFRIARTERARILLFLPPRNAAESSTHHFGGTTVLLRLALFFLYLSHAAGCLYWYVAVRSLTEAVSSPTLPGHDAPSVAWGEGSAFLPPRQYAHYLAGHVPGVEEALALSNATLASSLPFSAAARPATLMDAYVYCMAWGLLHVSGISFTRHEEPRQAVCVIIVCLVAIAANAYGRAHARAARPCVPAPPLELVMLECWLALRCHALPRVCRALSRVAAPSRAFPRLPAPSRVHACVRACVPSPPPCTHQHSHALTHSCALVLTLCAGRSSAPSPPP